MASPAIFNGRRTKLLTADGILTSANRTIDYDGPVNYIANGNAEIDTTGWATYADAAATSPVDGTGGSPSTTFTRSTSSPIRGQGSFVWTKSANNRQGEGFSYDFTIADADKGKVLTCNFNYAVASGTYADNDMSFWIYDVTNSLIIQPAPYLLKNHTLAADKMFLEFQTATSSTSYRLIGHIASTSASAYTLKFDGITLGPQAKLYGSVATDWINYTPTFNAGHGTVTAVTFEYKRVADSIMIRGKVSNGTTAASVAGIGLPAGLTIDDAKIQSTIQKVGTASRVGTDNVFDLLALTGGSATLGLGFGTTRTTNTNVSTIMSTGNTFTVESGLIPVTGWGASQVLSDDTDTRIVGASYYLSANFASSSTTPVNYDTKIIDTHSAVTTSATAWKFTAPVAGYYQVTLPSFDNNSEASVFASIYKNGSAAVGAVAKTNGATGGAGYGQGGGTVIQLVAGDYIDIRGAASITVRGGALTGTNTARVDIYKLSGAAQVLASEAVNARYYASATSLSGSLATISWTTKDFDSHGGMSAGTYTVPVPGKYLVNAGILISGTIILNNTAIMEIQKNGTVVSRNTEYAGGAITQQKVWADDIISCIAGDTLRIQVSSAATSPAIVSSNFDNYISLAKIGNL